MLPPTPELITLLSEFPYEDETQGEDYAADAFEEIRKALRDSVDPSPDDAYVSLGAVQSWAGLMSYVLIRTYAPSSLMRHATAQHSVSTSLWRAVSLLTSALGWISEKVRATGFTITVAFPFSVSVGITWPLGAQHDEVLMDRRPVAEVSPGPAL